VPVRKRMWWVMGVAQAMQMEKLDLT
jgi:hypothetical protein